MTDESAWLDAAPEPHDRTTPAVAIEDSAIGKSDFGNAGDRPPLWPNEPPKYPGTATLLRPVVFQDPSVTIDLRQAGIFGAADKQTNAAPTASWGTALRFVLPSLLGLGRTRVPRPTQRPTQPDPSSRPAPPQPPTDPRLPFPPVPEPERPIPDRQPDQQEPKPRPSPDKDPSENSSAPTLVPPTDDEVEALAKRFGEALAIVMQREDKRGTPSTVRGTNITIQECMDLASQEYRDLFITHIAGGNENGEFDGEYKTERNVETPSGIRRPDFTVRHKDADTEIDAYVNTHSTRKDGSPIEREQAALDALAEEAGTELVHGLRKLKPEDNEDRYREEARDKCRKVFDGIQKRRDDSEKKPKKPEKRPGQNEK